MLTFEIKWIFSEKTCSVLWERKKGHFNSPLIWKVPIFQKQTKNNIDNWLVKLNYRVDPTGEKEPS